MFASRFSHLVFLWAIVGEFSYVIADFRNFNPTGEGCVDQSGFVSCYKAQAAAAVDCENFCTTSTTKGSDEAESCSQGCSGHWLAGNVGCWIQSCWNEVYSCEYQLTAISYFGGTGLVQNSNIPFYPPPNDVSAGSCSCNLGEVYGNMTVIDSNLACSNVASTGDINAVASCQCCQFGYGISNSLNACPKSDLSVIGFSDKVDEINKIISGSTDNCAILDNSPETCVNDYKFPWVGTTTYNPLSLPTTIGKEPLSNRAGNAFTDFGADTFTLSLFPAYSSVITPAASKAGAAVATDLVDVNDATAETPRATPSVAGATSAAAAPSAKTTSGGGNGSKSSSGTAAPTATPTKSGTERHARSWIWASSLGVVFVMAISW